MIVTFNIIGGWSKVPAHCGCCDTYLIDHKEVFEFMNNWLCSSCRDYVVQLSQKEVSQ